MTEWLNTPSLAFDLIERMVLGVNVNCAVLHILKDTKGKNVVRERERERERERKKRMKIL